MSTFPACQENRFFIRELEFWRPLFSRMGLLTSNQPSIWAHSNFHFRSSTIDFSSLCPYCALHVWEQVLEGGAGGRRSGKDLPKSKNEDFLELSDSWSARDGSVDSTWPARTFLGHTNRLLRRSAPRSLQNVIFIVGPVLCRCKSLLSTCAVLAPKVRKPSNLLEKEGTSTELLHIWLWGRNFWLTEPVKIEIKYQLRESASRFRTPQRPQTSRISLPPTENRWQGRKSRQNRKIMIFHWKSMENQWFLEMQRNSFP